MPAKPNARVPTATPTSSPRAGGEVICEPGRHVNCLHAKMAAKRAK